MENHRATHADRVKGKGRVNRQRRGARLALSALVASALLLPVSASTSPALACGAGAAPGPQKTIEVQAKALKKVVKRGKVVKILVKTYRPAQKDFMTTGLDLPPGTPMQPAADMPFTLGVLTGNGYVYQNVASKTNSQGKRTVKMKLEKYHKPGSAEIRVRAFVDHLPNGQCAEIQEYGYMELKNAFKVL